MRRGRWLAGVVAVLLECAGAPPLALPPVVRATSDPILLDRFASPARQAGNGTTAAPPATAAAPGDPVALPEPAARGAATWRALVDRFAQGGGDEATAHIARWTHDELQAALGVVAQTPMPDRLVLVRHALLLHTTAGIAQRRGGANPSPGSGASGRLFFDGQQAGNQAISPHWILGRRLIERLPEGPDRTAVALTFYRATGALLAWWASHLELDAHLAAARRIVPDDPILLLYQGARHQIYAHPRAAAAIERRRREIALGPRALGRGLPALPSIDASRRSAEQALRAALRRDPELMEARVRLAHVLLDRERPDEALAILSEGTTAVRSSPLAYYAGIVEGLAHRRLGRHDAAARALTAAADLYPRAQTSRLLLSELALLDGDRPLARQQLGILAAARTEDDDPWVWLPRWHENAEADLALMYQDFAP